MKKVAVFGKPGSGKSTLSKTLAAATGIELQQLDSIQYQANGEQTPRNIFDRAHQDILGSDSWIIDGFGPLSAFNQRLEAADTLIYIDLPYLSSYWFVTKRCLKGMFVKPEGWPDGSSIIKGTLQSYKTLRLCPKFWNDEFLARIKQMSKGKKLYVIKSIDELNNFVSQKL